MPFFTWSTTPASNATADPTCPFPEGMAPSAVNDGVRGAMARLREFGNDISGSIVTTGSSTAYAVTSFQGFDTLAHLAGQAIAFAPHTTCGATVTLNVDGLGAKPLRTSPGVELLAGTIIQSTPYVATYNATDSAFYLHSFFASPYNIPIGGMMPFLSTMAPNSSFVLPYGQAISRTTYAALFAMTGIAFGAGDGSTTFNVPDLRGRIPVALDTMGGTAAGRITSAGSGVDGTTVGATGGAQNTTLITANLPPYTPSGSITMSGSQTINPLSFSGSGQGTGGTNTAVNNTINYTINGSSFIATWNGTAQGGTSTSFTNLSPTIIVPWILRVI